MVVARQGEHPCFPLSARPLPCGPFSRDPLRVAPFPVAFSVRAVPCVPLLYGPFPCGPLKCGPLRLTSSMRPLPCGPSFSPFPLGPFRVDSFSYGSKVPKRLGIGRAQLLTRVNIEKNGRKRNPTPFADPFCAASGCENPEHAPQQLFGPLFRRYGIRERRYGSPGVRCVGEE